MRLLKIAFAATTIAMRRAFVPKRRIAFILPKRLFTCILFFLQVSNPCVILNRLALQRKYLRILCALATLDISVLYGEC